jgi:hypothetical protein
VGVGPHHDPEGWCVPGVELVSLQPSHPTAQE